MFYLLIPYKIGKVKLSKVIVLLKLQVDEASQEKLGHIIWVKWFPMNIEKLV